MGLINRKSGWCYGPVLCEVRADGKVHMWCTDWASPGVPCPFKRTVHSRAAAAIVGLDHSRKHR